MKIHVSVRKALLAACLLSSSLATQLHAESLTWREWGADYWNDGSGKFTNSDGDIVAFQDGDDITFGDHTSYTEAIILLADFNPGSISFSGEDIFYQFEGSGSFTGSGAMSVDIDSGSWVVFYQSNENYEGDITITNGRLIAHRTNSLGKGDIVVHENAHLTLYEGLVPADETSARSIDVYGVLELGRTNDTTDYSTAANPLTVTLYDGATLRGESGNWTTNYTTLHMHEDLKTLNFDTDGTTGFIYLQQSIDVETVNLIDGVSVRLGKEATSSSIGTLKLNDNQSGASVYISNELTVDHAIASADCSIRPDSTDAIMYITDKATYGYSREDALEMPGVTAGDFVGSMETYNGKNIELTRQVGVSDTDSSWLRFDSYYNIELKNAKITNAAQSSIYMDNSTIHDSIYEGEQKLIISSGTVKFINTDLVGEQISMTIYNGSTTYAELTNVRIGKGTSFTVSYGTGVTPDTRISFTDTIIDSSALTITLQAPDASEESLVRNAIASSTVFQVDGLMDIMSGYKNSGSLTLDLGDLGGNLAVFNQERAQKNVVSIELIDTESLADLMMDGYDMSDILLQIGGSVYSFDRVETSVGGNATFSIIPEPSTVSLSMLALTALLARRRRRS